MPPRKLKLWKDGVLLLDLARDDNDLVVVMFAAPNLVAVVHSWIRRGFVEYTTKNGEDTPSVERITASSDPEFFERIATTITNGYPQIEVDLQP